MRKPTKSVFFYFTRTPSALKLNSTAPFFKAWKLAFVAEIQLRNSDFVLFKIFSCLTNKAFAVGISFRWMCEAIYGSYSGQYLRGHI